jgi:hypothetical protein
VKNMWVVDDAVQAESVLHRALGGDRRRVETYCGKDLEVHMTNGRVQADRPPSNVCPRCSVMATRA